MNSTQLLLLGLLVWFAMSNKSKDTRNVVLVVTGILFFCMMNVKEGFDLVEVPAGENPNMREVLDTTSGNTFNFRATATNNFLSSEESTTLQIPWNPTPSADITCLLQNGQTGIVGWAEGVDSAAEAEARASGPGSRGGSGAGSAAEVIDNLFTCRAPGPEAGTACEGTWSACGADCAQTYTVTKEATDGGAACEAAHDASRPCAQGEGDCPRECETADQTEPPCTQPTCIGKDIPHKGCIVPDCEGSATEPYEGCKVAPCGEDDKTPYEDCDSGCSFAGEWTGTECVWTTWAKVLMVVVGLVAIALFVAVCSGAFSRSAGASKSRGQGQPSYI